MISNIGDIRVDLVDLSADEQYRLGDMFRDEQNYDKAFECYKLSADKNYSLAQCALGVMYQKGIHVAINYKKAFEYFKLSADQNGYVAQYNLGVMYQYGKGVEQSDIEALKWYERSASQGYGAAQSKLESMSFINDYPAELAPPYYEDAAQGNNAAQSKLESINIINNPEDEDAKLPSYDEATRLNSPLNDNPSQDTSDVGVENPLAELNELIVPNGPLTSDVQGERATTKGKEPEVAFQP